MIDWFISDLISLELYVILLWTTFVRSCICFFKFIISNYLFSSKSMFSSKASLVTEKATMLFTSLFSGSNSKLFLDDFLIILPSIDVSKLEYLVRYSYMFSFYVINVQNKLTVILTKLKVFSGYFFLQKLFAFLFFIFWYNKNSSTCMPFWAIIALRYLTGYSTPIKLFCYFFSRCLFCHCTRTCFYFDAFFFPF